MLHDWGVIAAAFAYIGLLFFVASQGERLSPSQRGRAGMLIYPQVCSQEFTEPRRSAKLTGTDGYFARVGTWLRSSF